MNVLTYALIGFVVTALLTYMRRPKSPKGQTVALPALMAVIGWIDLVFFGGLTVWAYLDGAEIFELSVFVFFALLGGGMVIAYINCRISYDERGFTATNFWGITRSYTYDEITWLKGTRDIKLYVGDRVVRIDELAVGKTEFLCYAEARYMKTHGGRGIPTRSPDGKKGFDLFNGNVENPGEFIAVYVIMIVFSLGMFGFVVFDSRPLKAEELSYSDIQVERYAVEDDDLWLYADGSVIPFEIWGYATSLENAETFLQQCEDGTSFTVGYVSYPNADEPYHKLHYAEDKNGTVHLTMEAAQREEMKNTKEILLFVGLMGLVMFLFIAASIYVGRHPERFNRKIVYMFFKKEYIHIPVNKKR